jgi:hypothetical protein
LAREAFFFFFLLAKEARRRSSTCEKDIYKIRIYKTMVYDMTGRKTSVAQMDKAIHKANNHKSS